MSNFVAGHVTKMWFLKPWNTAFWTEILHLNLKEKKGYVVTFTAHLSLTLNKIQAKSSFGRHVAAQVMPFNMAANTNHITLLKSAIKYLPQMP